AGRLAVRITRDAGRSGVADLVAVDLGPALVVVGGEVGPGLEGDRRSVRGAARGVDRGLGRFPADRLTPVGQAGEGGDGGSRGGHVIGMEDADQPNRGAIPVVEVVLPGDAPSREHALRAEVGVVAVLGDVDHTRWVRDRKTLRETSAEIAGVRDLRCLLRVGVVAVEVTALEVEDGAAIAGESLKSARRRRHLQRGGVVKPYVETRIALNLESDRGAVRRRTDVARVGRWRDVAGKERDD